MTTWNDPKSNVVIAYDDRGTGLPVVLLHAFPQCREMWAPQVISLSDRYRIIAPDLPGFGGSELPEDGWTVDFAADLVADFLKGIGVQEKVILGGLSMGGYVALAFARRHAARLAGLILADTRAEADGPEAKANRDKAIVLAEDKGAAAVFEQMLPKVLGASTHQHRQAVVAETTRIAESQTAAAVAAAIRALRDRPDSSCSLPVIEVPTLVIVGSEDTLTPPDVARSLAGSIPNSTFVEIPAAGHLSNVEAPEAFNEAVRNFLDRVSRSTA